MMRGLLVCGAVVVAVAAASRADEEKVPLDKLPAAVKAAVMKRFPKAELTEAAKEVENGKTVYEVTIKTDGKKADVSVTPDGKLVSIEMELAVKDLPKAVTAGIEAKYPHGTITSAEEVIKVAADGTEKLAYYEALVTAADKKMYELEVGADGTILKTEDKTPAEKKDKK